MVVEEIVRVEELAHLWVHGRQVCSAFRRMIQALFCRRWLKDFTISINRGKKVVRLLLRTLNCRRSTWTPSGNTLVCPTI